jgi:tether containing UBX domain for GLUT4
VPIAAHWQTNSITVIEELPDEYFTPTISDLKERQQQLHQRAVALNNAPLQTRAQREQQNKAKRDRWPNVSFYFFYLVYFLCF